MKRKARKKIINPRGERRVTAAGPTRSSEVRTFAVFMGPNTPNSGWDGVASFNNNMTWEEFL